MDVPLARYLSVDDGFEIAYFVRGTGPTLVRVPVLWNHISRQWAPDYLGPFFDAMTQQFRLVLYDGRGQGLSTRGLTESLSLEDYVSDLGAIVDKVEPGRFVLMGMAQMSVVAIRYAIEHPERLSGLVLWNYDDYTARPATLIDYASRDWPRFVEATARMGFPEYDAAMVKDVLFDAVTQSDMVRQSTALRHGPSGPELLPLVRVPTLLLASREGSWAGATENESKQWLSLLPDARLTLVGGVGAGLTSSTVSGFEVVLRIEEFLRELEATQDREEPASVTDGPRRLALSLRQAEVLALVARGKTNHAIADELVLSVRTVERHLAEAYAKLGAHNRYEAIELFRKLSIDTPTE